MDGVDAGKRSLTSGCPPPFRVVVGDVAAVEDDAAMQWWPGCRGCPAAAVDAETVVALTTAACLTEDVDTDKSETPECCRRGDATPR